MAESKINNSLKIRKVHISGTTDNSGTLSVSNFDSNYRVVKVDTVNPAGNYLFGIPYWYDDDFGIKVMAFSTASPSNAPNRSVEFDVYYIDDNGGGYKLIKSLFSPSLQRRWAA